MSNLPRNDDAEGEHLADELQSMRDMNYENHDQSLLSNERNLHSLRAKQIIYNDTSQGHQVLILALTAFIGIPLIILVAIFLGR